jgi:anti-sigma regulatory factor (Ser/Thr protein kinase)
LEKIIIPIEAEQDVGLVRQEASELAKAMGFDDFSCAQVALGVSEIAQNVIRYGVRGKALMLSKTKNRVLRIEITDEGKGFENLDRAKQEGYSSSKSSLGLGLSVAKRAFDFFTIDSIPGEGATVILEKYLPYSQEVISYGSASMKDERYLINGDEFFIKEYDGDKVLLAVIDGMGQGELAYELSNFVLKILQRDYRLPLDQLLRICDKTLIDSKLSGGVVIALARISGGDQLEYIGIGDTHSYLYDGEVTFLENQEGRLGEYQLPTLKVEEYILNDLTNIILCTDGINTHIAEELLDSDTHPQLLANYIFNTYHRLHGDATVLIAQFQAGLL